MTTCAKMKLAMEKLRETFYKLYPHYKQSIYLAHWFLRQQATFIPMIKIPNSENVPYFVNQPLNDEHLKNDSEIKDIEKVLEHFSKDNDI